MASLLRRKLVCFYCGCRSAQKQDGRVRRWQCEKCEAVNHLDENGEITDPPALEPSSEVRYAQSIPRSVSPVFASTDETLFCPTCLKNQHLLTQTLAAYLPAPTDPQYSTFEASYPAYRESLEERYPQVCENCEPRVLERIRATGYAAKTDHLRRMMERTRCVSRRSDGWGCKKMIVLVGALGWWASLAGQVLWNVTGALAKSQDPDGLSDTGTTKSIPRCLQQVLQDRKVDQSCAGLAGPYGSLALALGVLSIWWNPLLKEKINGRGGRMVGLGEYYKLQVIVLAAKLVAWFGLGGNAAADLSPSASKGAHAFALAFTTLAAIISLRTVKMDYTPLVSFQDSPKPLITRKPRTLSSDYQHGGISPPLSQPSSFNRQPDSFIQPFPVHSLAPSPQRAYPPPYNPPTPPPDDNDADTMDWTPSQSPFHPNAPILVQRRSQTSAPPTEPSPFHGCLPPAPISHAHRLRNPPNQPGFHRTPPQEQQNFFNRITGRLSNPEGQRHPTEPPSRYPEMAPPKLFLGSDHRTETGLETLFSGVFSLGEEPREVRAAREQQAAQNSGRHPQEATLQASWPRVVSIILLLLASVAWKSAATHPKVGFQLRLPALGVATAVAGKNLLEAMGREKAYWNLSDILLFGCELAFAIFLGSAIKSSNGGLQDGIQSMGLALLGAMVLQEIRLLVSTTETRTAPVEPGNLPPAPTPSSRSQVPATHPPPPTILHTNEHQLIPSTPSQAQLQVHAQREPRTTRSRSKQTAAFASPSSGLEGLSLGSTGGAMEPKPLFAAWGGGDGGGGRGLVPRSARPRAWERGAL